MAKLRPTVLPEPVLAPADISENTLNATAPFCIVLVLFLKLVLVCVNRCSMGRARRWRISERDGEVSSLSRMQGISPMVNRPF